MNNKIILFTPPHKPSERYSHLLLNLILNPVMPVRLQYAVNPHKLVGHFCSMRCVTRFNGYYVFRYIAETESLCLNTHDNAKEPVMLGRAKVNYKQREMIFDVDSFGGAINMVNFLDEYIPEGVLELKTAATYNRFVFVAPSGYTRLVEYDNYDALFTEANMQLLDNNVTYHQNLNLLEGQERQKMLSQHPVIEKFAAWTSDDGISNLENMLQTRIAIARAISEGVDCSMWNFFQSLAAGTLN